MFNFIKKWLVNRHVKRIKAYQELPNLLQKLDKRNRELVQDAANNPPFPQEEMREKLNSVAIEVINEISPDLLPIIKKFAEDNQVDEGDVTLAVMTSTILPEMIKA